MKNFRFLNPESGILHSSFSILHSNVLYVGTFSKVLAPGFRVGWIVGPEEVIDKVVQAKQAVDLHTSTLSQRIVCEMSPSSPSARAAQLPLFAENSSNSPGNFDRVGRVRVHA